MKRSDSPGCKSGGLGRPVRGDVAGWVGFGLADFLEKLAWG